MRTSLSLLVIATILGAGHVHAQTKATKPAAPAASEKAADKVPTGGERVDISDIENKYWAPKDTDFSVVQNRTYTKEKRMAVSVLYGPIINDTFNEGNSTAIAANYFLNERYGLQFDYISSDYSNSAVVNAFRSAAGGASPDFGRPVGYYGIGFNYVPFYAKMSVLGKRIIYFDMAITPTIGMAQYEQLTIDGNLDKSSLSYGFDITQWFFIHKNIAIRADIKNRWFKEEVVKYQTDGSVITGTKLKNKNTDNTQFLLGVTVFF